MSYKFYQLKFLLQGKVDILVLTESKLDSSFPTNQFLIECFSKAFRFDSNRNGVSIPLYIMEDTPRKELKLHRHPLNIERIVATCHPSLQFEE